MNTQTQRVVELTVEQYAVDFLMQTDTDLCGVDLKAHMLWSTEAAMDHMRISMKIPAKVLQHDKIIVAYPKTLWDYVKRALGLRHRSIQVRLNESLLFPKVKIPPELGPVRVGTTVRIVTDDPFYEEDET